MKRKKRNRELGTLAAMLVLLAGGMAALLMLMPIKSRETAMNLPSLITLAPRDTLEVLDIPEDTPEVTPGPTAVPGEDFRYLPVVRHGETGEKVIAITVDDCFQVNNLKAILTVAHRNGGNLTLFPIGENLSKPGMAEVLRGCVYKLGDEIENHTWSHQRVFRLPEDEMAAEIWKQRAALNEILGADYEQHFFRLMGGDGETDQRTHNYLDQLGYRGIAGWSISGSDADMDMIKGALKPGAVFLFHTTDADTKKLREFIPYAVSQGYRLVTLNALMGYEDNALTPYVKREMPMPRAYREDYRVHKLGDYAWNVVRMQDALRALGCLRMDGPSTGYFGQQTVEAVKRFQADNGLPVTGVADSETQKRLIPAAAEHSAIA